MPQDEALYLGDVDPSKWRVKVNGKVYGPYTLGQMQTFVRERRIGPNTLAETGKRDKFSPACTHDALKFLFEREQVEGAEITGELANYLVIAHLVETAPRQFIGVLNRLGKFADVMPGVWALRSNVRQARIREELQAVIMSGEQVMIANASTGRLAWLNLGPEADMHIQHIWDFGTDQDS